MLVDCCKNPLRTVACFVLAVSVFVIIDYVICGVELLC